jgi:hypothetical protein
LTERRPRIFFQQREGDAQFRGLRRQQFVSLSLKVDSQNAQGSLSMDRIQFGYFRPTGRAPNCPVIDNAPLTCVGQDRRVVLAAGNYDQHEPV